MITREEFNKKIKDNKKPVIHANTISVDDYMKSMIDVFYDELKVLHNRLDNIKPTPPPGRILRENESPYDKR